MTTRLSLDRSRSCRQRPQWTLIYKESINVGSTRRKFTPEYKAEAVQFVLSSGKPIAEVARNLGIVEGTLGNWGVPRTREVALR
jgi:transposase-like protein